MRVIHVCDTAGVACILTKYQCLAGHDAKVMCSRNLTDRYGIYDFYKDFIELYSNEDFMGVLVKECMQADIVHVHSNIALLRKLRLSLGIEKKIILHYHGSDIRGIKKWDLRLPHRSLASDAIILSRSIYRKIFHKFIHRKAQKVANLVFLSQIDQLELVPNAIYVPIAVDTQLFTVGRQQWQRPAKGAITFKTEVTDMQLVLDHCIKNNIQIPEIYDRTQRPIMYKEMPQFLRHYETYVDIRYVNGKILRDLSSTALQALSCGLKVLDYNLVCLDSLPMEHEARNAASKVLDVYERLLGIDNN